MWAQGFFGIFLFRLVSTTSQHQRSIRSWQIVQSWGHLCFQSPVLMAEYQSLTQQHRNQSLQEIAHIRTNWVACLILQIKQNYNLHIYQGKPTNVLFYFSLFGRRAQSSDFRMSVLLLSLTSKHKLRNAHEIIILLQACTLLLPSLPPQYKLRPKQFVMQRHQAINFQYLMQFSGISHRDC